MYYKQFKECTGSIFTQHPVREVDIYCALAGVSQWCFCGCLFVVNSERNLLQFFNPALRAEDYLYGLRSPLLLFYFLNFPLLFVIGFSFWIITHFIGCLISSFFLFSFLEILTVYGWLLFIIFFSLEILWLICQITRCIFMVIVLVNKHINITTIL